MITKRTINEARAQLDAAQRGTRQRQLRYADIDEAVTAYREFRAGIKRRDLPLDADTVKVERYGGGVSRSYAYPASSTYVTSQRTASRRVEPPPVTKMPSLFPSAPRTTSHTRRCHRSPQGDGDGLRTTAGPVRPVTTEHLSQLRNATHQAKENASWQIESALVS